MSGFTAWWLDRPVADLDWKVPISSWQRFRPVGGYLAGSAGHIEFIPNRFEAMVGGRPWKLALADVDRVVLVPRRLRITFADGEHVLVTHRSEALRRHLGFLLEPAGSRADR